MSKRKYDLPGPGDEGFNDIVNAVSQQVVDGVNKVEAPSERKDSTLDPATKQYIQVASDNFGESAKHGIASVGPTAATVVNAVTGNYAGAVMTGGPAVKLRAEAAFNGAKGVFNAGKAINAFEKELKGKSSSEKAAARKAAGQAVGDSIRKTVFNNKGAAAEGVNNAAATVKGISDMIKKDRGGTAEVAFEDVLKAAGTSSSSPELSAGS